ncbi:MAG: HlyD family efflux transporter periplasmic adaptor subunit [Candidatus Paceibacterota bacterium]
MFKHKILTLLAAAALLVAGIFIYQGNSEETLVRYVTAAVEKGSIVISVSGSGQISALEETDIKSEVNSAVSNIYVKKGQEVTAGQLVAVLDKSDLEDELEDAELAYDSAKEDLESLTNPDEDDIKDAEDALADAKEAELDAEDAIAESYEDAFNDLSSTFLDLAEVVDYAKNILYSYDIAEDEARFNNSDDNKTVYENLFALEDRAEVVPFLTSADDSYLSAKEDYDEVFSEFKSLTINYEQEDLEDILSETSAVAKSFVQVIKNEINLIDFTIDYLTEQDKNVPSQITSYQSGLRSKLVSAASVSSAISSTKQSIENSKDALSDAEELVVQKEEDLEDLLSPDELDVRSMQSALRQKQKALESAQEDLANCEIYSPYNGVITEVSVERGDSVSSGTVLASIITHQKVAEISLNEVDAALVEVGQKVVLTFDALSDITATGKVTEVDEEGESSQGVVNYGVVIALDSDLESVKTGMSVTADIVTEMKQDILTVPNGAVKSQGENYYVELVDTGSQDSQTFLANVSNAALGNYIKTQTVEIGISNDSYTEIVSGLEEDDVVISSSASISNDSDSESESSDFQMPGGSIMGGMNMMR